MNPAIDMENTKKYEIFVKKKFQHSIKMKLESKKKTQPSLEIAKKKRKYKQKRIFRKYFLNTTAK